MIACAPTTQPIGLHAAGGRVAAVAIRAVAPRKPGQFLALHMALITRLGPEVIAEEQLVGLKLAGLVCPERVVQVEGMGQRAWCESSVWRVLHIHARQSRVRLDVNRALA